MDYNDTVNNKTLEELIFETNSIVILFLSKTID